MKYSIPLSRPSFNKSEIDLVTNVMKSEWLTHGKYNQKFESNFNKKFKFRYSLTLNSCTSALELAIKVNNITGEVIVPSFTWVSSANAIVSSGAKPVFCDSDYQTRNVTLDNIKSVYTKKTQAIMVVHFGGQSCEMDKISKFCLKNNLYLIEDSAESIGGKWKGKYVGSWGIGCFSFFPTKNLTTGEGGLISTNNKIQWEKMKSIAAHGLLTQSIERENMGYNFWDRVAIYPGHNYRMSNILAAIGYIQLKKLDKFNNQRRKIASLYNKLLINLPLQIPVEHKNAYHVYQMYTITVEEKYRDRLVNYLKKQGIGASVHFSPPLHLHPFYDRNFKTKQDLKNAVRLSKTIVTLPIYYQMTNKDVKSVCECIKIFFKKNL